MNGFTLNSQMKTTRQIDGMKITNEVIKNAAGDVVMEEVTCETGQFRVLSLVPSCDKKVSEATLRINGLARQMRKETDE